MRTRAILGTLVLLSAGVLAAPTAAARHIFQCDISDDLTGNGLT